MPRTVALVLDIDRTILFCNRYITSAEQWQAMLTKVQAHAQAHDITLHIHIATARQHVCPIMDHLIFDLNQFLAQVNHQKIIHITESEFHYVYNDMSNDDPKTSARKRQVPLISNVTTKTDCENPFTKTIPIFTGILINAHGPEYHKKIHCIGSRHDKNYSLEWISQQHGIPPQNTIIIDDNSHVIAGAKEAGFSTLDCGNILTVLSRNTALDQQSYLDVIAKQMLHFFQLSESSQFHQDLSDCMLGSLHCRHDRSTSSTHSATSFSPSNHQNLTPSSVNSTLFHSSRNNHANSLLCHDETIEQVLDAIYAEEDGRWVCIYSHNESQPDEEETSQSTQFNQ